MQWTQAYTPIGGNLLLSALAALVPIIFFFWALAIKRMKGYTAGLATLGIALIIAVLVYRMPAEKALMSATQGAVYGLLPIGWIIVTSVFLYKITVKTGQFDIIRSSVLSITDDRRLQALLIAFSFGAFLEGAAGFGAPVAISAALLVGLGFNPLYAAGICLNRQYGAGCLWGDWDSNYSRRRADRDSGDGDFANGRAAAAVFIRIYSSLFNHHHERVQESLGGLAGDSRIWCFLCCCSISQFQFFRA
ncbi:nitrogen fixation-related uncharacterized protein [Bacillus subtilis]